jgi:small-conductance mechanosensitive channel
MSSESTENAENRRIAGLTEMDKSGDKASFLRTDRDEDRAIRSTMTGQNYPPDIHDLQRQTKEEERKDGFMGSNPHNDRSRFYLSLILSIVTIGLAIFSLVNVYQASMISALMIPATFTGFVLLFTASGLLAIVFVYTAFTAATEIRIHRQLKQQNM